MTNGQIPMMNGITLDHVVLGVIALANLATAYLAREAKKIAAETRVVAVETKIAAEKTELNTNSMREALVLATGQAERAAGKEEGRAEGAAKAAILAEGKLAREQ